jgi:hypothetical protein
MWRFVVATRRLGCTALYAMVMIMAVLVVHDVSICCIRVAYRKVEWLCTLRVISFGYLEHLSFNWYMLACSRPFITSTVWSLSRIPFTPPFSRKLNTIPNMSAITDNDIVARFEKLSLSKPQIYEHAPVANGAQWKAELEKIGKGNVTLTKTVGHICSSAKQREGREDEGPS